MPNTPRTVAFQGNIASYAHLAANNAYPNATAHPYPTFEAAFAATENGETDLSLIPIENSTMGRIADIHHLMPATTLHIIAEYYLPIQHCLMAKSNTKLEDITTVYSQLPALTQCQNTLKNMGFTPRATADTAGAAKMVAAKSDPHAAALASSFAAETYGLTILNPNMNDADHNTTRFIALSHTPEAPPTNIPAKTSLLFTVNSVPAALYKALGCFAEHSLNLTKLESYLIDGNFTAAQFYIELEAHAEQKNFTSALTELKKYTQNIKILGCYPLKLNTTRPIS